jgi:hypothetical protein
MKRSRPRCSFLVCLCLLAIAGGGLLQSQDPIRQDPSRPARAEGREKGGKRPKGGPKGGPAIQKPKITDAVRANVYADNWFQLYINGHLVAVDSISFIPHNVVSVEILPEYPMTIAVMARDNADPVTGLEYDNTQIGDGGFILKFADGTVTNATWKAKSVFHGPVDGDQQHPKTRHEAIPENWFAVDFDDNAWEAATEHTEEAVGPKEPFYQHDFEGAKWIWTKDLALDNTVLFRIRVGSPPDGRPLPPKWPRGHIDETTQSSSKP